MTSPTAIERDCYWLTTRQEIPADPLTGDHETDYVIVGAGLTGLWTALTIKLLEPAAGVTVVEQGVAAYGGSGRNAGMLSETVDHGHGLAIQHFGAAEARRLARLGEDNIAAMYRDLADWGVECELERTGRLMIALTPAQLEECHRTIDVARDLGLDSFSFLDGEAIRSRLHSPLYLGGVKVSGGGILNPVKLVDGLAREARRRGIKLHERSKVLSVTTEGAGARIRTAGGSARARKVILATSAYTHHLLPEILHRFIPLYDYIMVSEPLTAGPVGAARLAGTGGCHRSQDLLQLLSPDGGWPRALGDQRGRLPRQQPGGGGVRSLTSALPVTRDKLAAALPGAGRSQVGVPVGRGDLLHDPDDSLLRSDPRREDPSRTGVHRSRSGHHATRRADPGPPGAGPAERSA